jgi:hypothetical protein
MNKKNHKCAHCRLVLQHDKINKLTICECVVYYHNISTDFIKKKDCFLGKLKAGSHFRNSSHFMPHEDLEFSQSVHANVKQYNTVGSG